MPWPVYSIRFAQHSGGATYVIYTVPSGHTAVVKHIASVNATGGPQTFVCQVNGIYVYYVTLQASTFNQATGLQLVAYGGEQIKISGGASGASMHCGGYLFTNPAGAADDAPAVTHELREEIQALPAEVEGGHAPSVRDRRSSVQRGVRRWDAVVGDVRKQRSTAAAQAAMARLRGPVGADPERHRIR